MCLNYSGTEGVCIYGTILLALKEKNPTDFVKFDLIYWDMNQIS